MRSVRIFILGLFICLLIGIFVGCQSRQTYTSQQLGLTISYPTSWEFGGESESVIMLRSYYSEDAAIRITTLEPPLADAGLTDLMEEQLNLWVQASDPNMPIEYGEIQEREHKQYLIVTGYVAGHPKIKVSHIDPLFRTYAAAIQLQDKVVFVTAEGTGYESQQNAIEEIIKGLEFR